MLTRIAMLLILVPFTARAADDDPTAKKELAALHGEWIVTHIEDGGDRRESTGQFALRIEGDRYTFTEDDVAVDEGTLSVHPATKPKTMEALSERDARATLYAIYKIEGDIFTVYLSRNEADRPKDFKTRPNEGSWGYTMKRKKES